MTQEALKLALEALEKCRTYHQQDWSSEETTKPEVKQAITAIKEALAQPEQEPVKYSDYEPDGVHHTTPPQRTWVGLTDEEISEVLGSDIHDEPSGELRFIRAIEAKLKEKNT